MSRLLSSAPHRCRPAGPPPPPLPSPITTSTATAGLLPSWSKTKLAVTLHCNAISRPQSVKSEVIERRRVIKWAEDEEDKDRKVGEPLISDKIDALIKSVASILNSIGDGHITPSPYDTAWVALLPDARHRPRFPLCLDWISRNQLGDGSWGDSANFSLYDRLLNTLACVIALKTWDVHSHKCQQGIRFIEKNVEMIEEENEEQMPIGFEVTFPSLIEIAQNLNLNLEIPHDSDGLRRIYLKRHLKLTRIPRDVMHQVPTTLLHSLEGLPGLNWEMLTKLQSADGSFLFSPSSTAFALRHTGDLRSHHYLANIVRKFDGGVPNVYPVDLFERLWAVDRLQRLGLSRYFTSEIEACIDYVHRHWSERGICWARKSEVEDIDDTSMGFRLLRMHGRRVSADVFRHFEKGGEFVCFAGQSTQAVTGMYNLYRASQLMYPGEEVMARAANFAGDFLREKRAGGELVDKWIITKDLPGEVGYALDVPWYASLPRLEARFYLEQYGGQDDVWIGKTLYRMPNVNNNTYLELAKVDYNNCQALHQHEWALIQRWYKNLDMGEVSLSEGSLLLAYYTSAASAFEPESSETRLAWAKTSILLRTLHYISLEKKHAFIEEFENGSKYQTTSSLVGKVMRTVNELSLNVLLSHGKDIFHELNQGWLKWVEAWQEEGKHTGNGDVELIVRTINLTREWQVEEDGNSPLHPMYQTLLEATANVCHQIRMLKEKEIDGGGECATTPEIEAGMRKLVQLVYTRSKEDMDFRVKQNFLMVAKSFYYEAYFCQGTINFHMAKVLFESVV